MPPVKEILWPPLPSPLCVNSGLSGHNVRKELSVEMSDASKEFPGIWIVPSMALIELLSVFITKETDIFPSIGQEVALLIREMEGPEGCTDANAQYGKTDKIAVKKIKGIALMEFLIILLNFM